MKQTKHFKRTAFTLSAKSMLSTLLLLIAMLVPQGTRAYNLTSLTLGSNTIDNNAGNMPVAIAVTIGSATQQFIDFDEALPVALAAESADVTLLADVTLPDDENLFFDKGNVTLDLNGHSITGDNYDGVIEVDGGSLTITDKTEGKCGQVVNNSANAIKAYKGSLTINAGTFIGGEDGDALYAVSENEGDLTLSVSGGRFVTNGWAAVETWHLSALAPGYAYYKTNTDIKLEDIDYEYIKDENGEAPATDITVKLAVGDEVTLAINDASEAHSPVVITKGENDTFTTDQIVDFTNVTSFIAPVDFVANNGVSYDRDLTALTGSDWGTLCLPFDIPADAATGVTFYTLVNATSEAVTISAVTSGTIEAGTPLLFKKGSEATSLGISTSTATTIKSGAAAGSAAQGDYLQLQGTFVPKNVTLGYYLDAADGLLHSIQAWSSDNQGAPLTIPAFRAWFAPSQKRDDGDDGGNGGNVDAKALNIIIEDEEATAIDALNALIQGKATIYGLDGNKRSDLQKGINIVNGRKILVK